MKHKLTQLKNYLLQHKRALTILLIIAIPLLTHGMNMLQYPYFENDEGVYFAQAYAVAYEGKLSRYTYWYDHAPLGWITTAVWMRLTGGPFSFGYSLNSARIFMLLVHVMSSTLLYLITLKLTKKKSVALLSVLFFSVTPLGIYFQRRLLLDNIMTLWVLASTLMILIARFRLKLIIAAGIFLSFAVLTKETAIFAIPPLLLLTILTVHKKQRLMSFVIFLLPIAIGVLYFVTLALLKGELFPGEGHVSLIGTWTYQLSRGSNLPFWNESSDFYLNLKDWMSKDLMFPLFSLVANIWMVIGTKKSKVVRLVGLLGLSFWFFLVRGGLVINFYIIPVIATGALSCAILFKDIIEIPKGKYLAGLLIALYIFTLKPDVWILDETSVQRQSVDWVKKNVPSDAVISADYGQLLDLQLSRFPGDPAMTRAHWFFKIALDGEVKDGVLHNNWRNIQFLLLTHEFIKQLSINALPFFQNVLPFADTIKGWESGNVGTYVNIPALISTNGDWVQLRELLTPSMIVLRESWNFYKANFIFDGKVLDPKANVTTSEGQSYALLRSVVVNDREAFDSVWSWTKNHMQFRREDKLFSWKWGEKGGREQLLDSAPASDADIDIATALILAHKKWGDEAYLTAAKEIIPDIWRQLVIQIPTGRYYLLAGTWSGFGEVITVNPSYFSPAAYRLFAEVDPSHPWNTLARDTYRSLNELTLESKTRLVPDWIGVVKSTGEFVPSPERGLSGNFGYDAMRTYFRVAQDAQWFGTQEAKNFLQSGTPYLLNEWRSNSKILAGYTLPGGKALFTFEDSAFYGALLPAIAQVDPLIGEGIQTVVEKSYVSGAWGDPSNYYTQNWVWFGLALKEQQFKP